MQEAVTVMRSAGYRGVISIPGIDFANNLSKWLTHMPKDPHQQLIAEAHVYGKNTCSSVSCLDGHSAGHGAVEGSKCVHVGVKR